MTRRDLGPKTTVSNTLHCYAGTLTLQGPTLPPAEGRTCADPEEDWRMFSDQMEPEQNCLVGKEEHQTYCKSWGRSIMVWAVFVLSLRFTSDDHFTSLIILLGELTQLEVD